MRWLLAILCVCSCAAGAQVVDPRVRPVPELGDETGVAQANLAFEKLAAIRDGLLDVRVMLGTHDPEVARVARLGAYEAASLLAQAQSFMPRRADELARRPDFFDSELLQDRRSEYLVSYLEHRMPLAVARSAAVLGVLEENETTRAAFGELVVEEVTGRVAMDERHRAELALLRGYGELLRGDDPSETFLRAHELARALGSEHVSLVIESGIMDAVHSPESRTIEGATRDLIERWPFVDEGTSTSDASMLLLIEGLIGRSEGMLDIDGSQSERVLELACDVYESLRARPRFEGDHLGLRESVLERFAETRTGDSYPLLVDVSRAWRLGGEGRDDEAIELLRGGLDGSDGAWLDDARWELALALIRASQEAEPVARDAMRSEAMSHLTDVFTIGGWPDSERSARLACALAERMPASLVDEARHTLESALRVFPETGDADEWRFALASRVDSGSRRRELLESVGIGSDAYAPARVMLADIQHGVFQNASDETRGDAALELLGRCEEARAVVDSVEDGGQRGAFRERLDAQAIEALLYLDREDEALALARLHEGSELGHLWLGAMSSQLRRKMVQSRREGDDQSTRRIATMLVEVCRLRARSPIDRAQDLLRRAVMGEAMLELDDASGALEVFRALREERVDDPRLAIGAGDALWRLGREEEAFVDLRAGVGALERADV
ncbi:MAG: hypothetical protein ACYTF7_06030, partial [Planctomycetota bacterium]